MSALPDPGETCEGWKLVGRRYELHRRDGTLTLFVQKAEARGARWFRFLRKMGSTTDYHPTEWWVTNYPTRKLAVAGL